jgi:enoyl-[acyl-carrier protein] reductase II
MKSVLCDLLGIQYPMFQGGMAWVADWSLASAVTNAGGLGILSAGTAPVEYVREQVRRTRAAVGNKPFGVNVMLLSPTCDEIAPMLAEEGVPVVTTGAGMPRYMELWKAAAIKVFPVVPSVAIAKKMERMGADGLVAEGGEAGGHVGDLTTMTLVPQVTAAVRIPVLAAGGIADGRGIAASVMLGACGVQVGTRFLVAKECSIHQNYKDKVLKASDIGTMTTGNSLGHPVRALRTVFTRQFLKNERDPSMTLEEVEAFGAGALRKAVIDGDEVNGCFMAGQSAGMVTCEQSCREIIEEMFSQADHALKGAAKWVD